MATIPTPIIHYFKEVNPGKYRSVKHFQLDQVKNGKSLLTNKINISKDRKFAKSAPDYWLKVREGNKWSKPITGLFKTKKRDVYHGDSQYKKDLIIAQFADQDSKVIVYYYKNFYTGDLHHILNFHIQ